MNLNEGQLLQQAALADAQQKQHQAYLKALHTSTAQRVYSHLAAIHFQQTKMIAAHKANPLGLEEPQEQAAPVFDIGELMQAGSYSKFAATVFMVALGELSPAALKQYQKKE